MPRTSLSLCADTKICLTDLRGQTPLSKATYLHLIQDQKSEILIAGIASKNIKKRGYALLKGARVKDQQKKLVKILTIVNFGTTKLITNTVIHICLYFDFLYS